MIKLAKKSYVKQYTSQISFPLGGIGTGSIGLGGNGMLVDWEIFNRPNKGSYNGFTHFAIKTEKDEKIIDSRVIAGDYMPPYAGELTALLQGYGHGVKRERMTGLPNFPDWSFKGEFPIATINYKAKGFPGRLSLKAFNPFIPHDDLNSSIPAAMFEFKVKNDTDVPLKYTIAFSCKNPFTDGTSVNTYTNKGKYRYMELGTDMSDKKSTKYGNLTMVTTGDDGGHQRYWYRGKFADELTTFWREFNEQKEFIDREYKENPATRTIYGNMVHASDTATIATSITVEPGKTGKIPFVLSWYFPNVTNTWRPFEIPSEPLAEGEVMPDPVWKNHYATIYSDSKSAGLYAMRHFSSLLRKTESFKNALFNSTLPAEVIDAVSANLSTLKSPAVLRLPNGEMYFFEGCNSTTGCCEGSCTHVLNYAYALPFLYPKLERTLRDSEYKYNQRKSGAMTFRISVPLGSPRWAFRACVDGQFGTVIKVYRDWKITGDTKWLESMWDKVKLSLEFAWSEHNPDKWDYDKDGVMEGAQHHTLDMELFGPNGWLNAYYLAALKACSEMAKALGDEKKEIEYRELFEKGKKWTDENLFNGDYYIQKIDITDRNLLDGYPYCWTMYGESYDRSYWNPESGQIKYQLGTGCYIDQVAAQWHANMAGLGEILDKDKVDKALDSIYKYNFKKSMRDYANTHRVYALYDEACTVNCEWPKGDKPHVPAPYSQESFHGMEYQAACHMIQNGKIDKGLEMVRAVRDRYDGYKRNPWGEFESGTNYVRSMASYALLNTFLGLEYHGADKMIGFSPITKDDPFKAMWSLQEAYGTFEFRTIENEEKTMVVNVLEGMLKIDIFKSEEIKDRKVIRVRLSENDLEFTHENGSIKLKETAVLNNKDKLTIYLGGK